MNSMREHVLALGADDWVPLFQIERIARAENPGLAEGAIREEVLDCLIELATTAGVRVGDIAGAGFVPWDGTEADWRARLSEILEEPDRDRRGFEAWLDVP